MMKRQCFQCKREDEGAEDPNDKKWYCNQCWSAYMGAGAKPTARPPAPRAGDHHNNQQRQQQQQQQQRPPSNAPGKQNSANSGNGKGNGRNSGGAERNGHNRNEASIPNKARKDNASSAGPSSAPQPTATDNVAAVGSPSDPAPQNRAAAEPYYPSQQNTSPPTRQKDPSASGSSNAAGRSGRIRRPQTNDDSTGNVDDATRRLAALVNQVSRRKAPTRGEKLGLGSMSVVEGFLSGNVFGSTSSFVSQAMQSQQPIAVIAHSGQPLSPRGDKAGGVGRSAYQDEQKVSLDMLLSSVDDIVSQVYVYFDEAMTKIILNALDTVTSCETQDERDRVTPRISDELVESLGMEHYNMIQCILHRPRDIFLRLLEEFCTLEDKENTQSGAPAIGATVRFIKSTKRRHGAVGSAEENAEQRWLAHMNRRFRALMQQSELDQILKRDFSISGATIPKGTTILQKEEYAYFHIPPPVPEILPESNRVSVTASLPEWCHPAFLSITHLNTIQTKIFRTAFHTSQNMLVCAPTGAGKTVCALLVMLRCIQDHFENGQLNRDFKIIFIAPMKALAQEMVTNFSKRLAPFMIVVRELTGDMQLTKREIAETQVIVTTPEKWDVVTRKQADNDLVRTMKLLIIDEIHLLNDDRGPVLEAVVARTLRHEETDTQDPTRIVGLSATLPNYKDVANFLHVDLAEGLKVFGPEYRPVPLEQTFLGLNDTSRNNEKKLDELAYKEVVNNVRKGHQVMVFVHSRKQTIELAKYFMEEAKNRAQESIFKQTVPGEIAKKGGTLQGRDLSALFSAGFGAHHAGLVRYDRTTTEALFRDGYIRVLICTSTLAWGVNLPAHTVIIRGTQLYDPKRGGRVSISVLDVMQIFGRAGRPQFDTSGHGIIISDIKQVGHYLRLIASALPIESQLQNKLCDHLNAEIQAGSIASIAEGVKWLEYTYMWQRMRVNPLSYGLKIADVRKDPRLRTARYEIISSAAARLNAAGMVRYNADTGSVDTTDLGRIASHYYVECESIVAFNEKMRNDDETFNESLDMGSALNIIACANEFSQLRARQEELDELNKIHLALPRSLQLIRISKDSADETSIQWKVTTLIKAYISKVPIEMHSLVSDTNYVVQNAPRIARALFEIEIQRGHPVNTYTFLTICICVERRCWESDHPLRQFNYDFTDAVLRNLQEKNPSMGMLQEMTPGEIGALVRNQRFGGIIANLVQCFPAVEITADVQPITRTILRVKVTITPNFTWSAKYSMGSEQFWLMVEDQDNHFIFHHEMVTLKRKDVMQGTPVVVNLSVPVVAEYDMYCVRLYSDRWLGCCEDYTFSIAHLNLPDDMQVTTKLLPLSPLRREVIPEAYHSIYQSFTQLNAIQSQTFHAMFHTDASVFLGAPTGSGKTVAAEMAMLRVFEKYPGGKVVYIAPLKALVKERLRDWTERFDKKLSRRVVELSGDVTPDISALIEADILCTTPEKWDGISRNWQVRSYVKSVRLVIFDEIHMLGGDRGPVIEVIVSRMRYIGWHQKQPIRLVGLSTAVANPGDLSSWLGVNTAWSIFNFDPSVRPVPMRVHIAGYHGRNFCPRMAAMNRPTYNAICEKSPNKPVIVFVPSRRQTRLTAMGIIGCLIAEQNSAKFVRVDVDEMQRLTDQIEDPYVKHCIQFGVGMHHAGLVEGDKAVVENAFLTGKLQILVATSTLAWGVNFPAHMVVVKGTEYYDGKTCTWVDYPITDVLQMIGRAGRPQFDTEGVAQVLCHEPKKGFYRKFLYDPFPVESALHKQLHEHINAEIVAGTISTRQDAVDYLTWTYLFRRLVKNPSYYGLEDRSPKAVTIFLSALVKQILEDLEKAGCLEPPPEEGDDEEEDVDPNALRFTVIGKLCSYYYISHHTAQLLDAEIKEDNSSEDLLRLMCEVEEFAPLPVRHNEDKLNLTLAAHVPLSINPNDADSPHVKAFLLFQGHFERARLPIADFYIDQKLALDNAVRVVQAMVDIAANSGHLHSTLRCMGLLQCMVQGVWWDSDTLLQIPHLTPETIARVRHACPQIQHVAQIASGTSELRKKLESVLAASDGCDLQGVQLFEAVSAVRGFPLIDVGLALELSCEDEDGNDPIFDLTVNLTRLTPPQRHVVAPRFSKAKDEQFWIAVGCERTGELVAVKRVNRLHKQTSVKLRFEWDDDWADVRTTNGLPSSATLQVYVVCDSYIGLDQQYAFEVENPEKYRN